MILDVFESFGFYGVNSVDYKHFRKYPTIFEQPTILINHFYPVNKGHWLSFLNFFLISVLLI